MRIIKILVFLLIVPFAGVAQQIFMSPFQKEDDMDMNFEILGRVDTAYLVYKNSKWKHSITLYSRNMEFIRTERLKFLPERTLSAEFIMYPDFFYMIYQFERSGNVYCAAVKLNQECRPVSEPLLLDSSRTGSSSAKKIYTLVVSDDKKQAMIFKMLLKSGRISIVSRLYDKTLSLVDSSVYMADYDERYEFYSDLLLSNEGTVFFAKNKRKSRNDYFSELELVSRGRGDIDFSTTSIPLQDKFIDEVFVKIDNLNKSVLLNSFYYDRNKGGIDGLFTALFRLEVPPLVAFSPIEFTSKDLGAKEGGARQSVDNLYIKNIFVRRNGSFVLVAENFSSRRQADNVAWNRADYLSNYPFWGPGDFIYGNPYSYYPGAYRFYRPYTPAQSTRYYYEDIHALSIDSSLAIKWKSVINKKQYDDDNENYLSYGSMSYGGELHFFFIEDKRKADLVSNQGILPDGEVRRYPPIRGRQQSYSFMPRLAKQVGAREMIVPCSFRGNINFALVSFN